MDVQQALFEKFVTPGKRPQLPIGTDLFDYLSTEDRVSDIPITSSSEVDRIAEIEERVALLQSCVEKLFHLLKALQS